THSRAAPIVMRRRRKVSQSAAGLNIATSFQAVFLRGLFVHRKNSSTPTRNAVLRRIASSNDGRLLSIHPRPDAQREWDIGLLIPRDHRVTIGVDGNFTRS